MLRTRQEPGFQPVFDFLPAASRAEHLFRVGRDLDGLDEAGLMNQARADLKAYDAAYRRDDDEECGRLRQRLDVIAERLPPDDDDAEEDDRLTRLLAAPPGKVPLWGQKGGFIITCKFRFGITCRVVIRSGMEQLQASAFDWDGMFLTDSGYLVALRRCRPRPHRQTGCHRGDCSAAEKQTGQATLGAAGRQHLGT